MRNLYLVFFFYLSISFHCTAQFQRTEGRQIVDAQGNEIIWRGIGLGGWMLQEGYMLGTSGAQHELEERIDELVGIEQRKEFYDAWWNNHTTKTDVDSIASWGFNMIRLPMHYKLYTPPIEDEPVPGEITWIDRGFTMTDSLIAWCKQNNIYLILDLHAAPGGQGENADISDYDPSKPSLWESDLNKEKTVALWRKLAERYANEPTIVAYDLINEPNWGFQDHANDPNGCAESDNTPLWELQKDITTAIREVDNNHIVVLEGNCWGGNYQGLPDLWDDNLVISYHKYWNDEKEISAALDMRASRGVPVWLGETGENSNTWFTNTVITLESNNIGWAWWPLKKLGLNNPVEIPRNDKYQAILDYWDNPNENAKPDQQDAYEGLMTLANDTRIENAIYHKDVPDALIRQPHTTETIPFVWRELADEELIIHATDFDLGRNGFAYYDTDTANYHGSTGNYTAWNLGWSYRNDGVDIQPSEDEDEKSNGFNVGWTEPGEWMQYTLEVQQTDAYQISIRYAAQSAGKIYVSVNDAVATGILDLPSTGGYQSWETLSLENMVLEAGLNKIRIYIDQGINIGYYSLAKTGGLDDMPFEGLGARTGSSGFDVVLDLTQPVDPQSVSGSDGFKLVIDGNEVDAVSTVIDPRKIKLITDARLYDSNNILVRYSNQDIVSKLTGKPLETIEDLEVVNTLPVHYEIPGTIQAEDFFTNQGLALEATSDAGGGFNIAYTNVGDFLEYRIFVPESGIYEIDSRVACLSNSGKFSVQQIGSDGSVENEVVVEVPVTGGWQEWETVSNGEIQLDEGRWTMKITITDTEFNLNWLRFSKKKVLGVAPNTTPSIFYPNPTKRYINLSNSEGFDFFKVIQLDGSVISEGRVENDKPIDLKNVKTGFYIILLENSDTGVVNKYKVLKTE